MLKTWVHNYMYNKKHNEVKLCSQTLELTERKSQMHKTFVKFTKVKIKVTFRLKQFQVI